MALNRLQRRPAISERPVERQRRKPADKDADKRGSNREEECPGEHMMLKQESLKGPKHGNKSEKQL